VRRINLSRKHLRKILALNAQNIKKQRIVTASVTRRKSLLHFTKTTIQKTKEKTHGTIPNLNGISTPKGSL
jgi:hypothetical protein